MEDKRMCLLDDNKLCDDCGECDRCDLDPNKLCDNCCKCLALEDDSEFRTVTLDGTVVSDKSFFHKANADGHELRSALDKAAAPKQSKKKSHGGVLPFKEEEPTEKKQRRRRPTCTEDRPERGKIPTGGVSKSVSCC